MSNASRHLHMGCGEALTGRWLGALGQARIPDPWAAFTKPRSVLVTTPTRGQRGRRRQR